MRFFLHWMRRDLSQILLALLLAITFWIIVSNEQYQTSTIPGSVPVRIENLPDNMVIIGDIPNVRVSIDARADIINKISGTDFQPTVDLSRVQQSGVLELPVTVTSFRREVRSAIAIPQRVTIRVEAIQTKNNVPVRLRYLDTPGFGVEAGQAELSPLAVTLTGTQDRLNQVDQVVAELRYANRTSNISEQVEVVPQDARGEPVRDVEVTPRYINVSVPISQQLAQRSVPVLVQTSGNVAPGYMLTGYSVAPTEVVLVGDPDLIKNIQSVSTEPIDISNLQREITRTVKVIQPQDVGLLRSQPVQVRIQVKALQGQITTRVVPRINGLSEGMTATFNISAVDIACSGPLPVLQQINPETLRAEINLSGLLPGTHLVRVTATSTLPITINTIQPELISVTIAVPPTPVPTAVPGPPG